MGIRSLFRHTELESIAPVSAKIVRSPSSIAGSLAIKCCPDISVFSNKRNIRGRIILRDIGRDVGHYAFEQGTLRDGECPGNLPYSALVITNRWPGSRHLILQTIEPEQGFPEITIRTQERQGLFGWRTTRADHYRIGKGQENLQHLIDSGRIDFRFGKSPRIEIIGDQGISRYEVLAPQERELGSMVDIATGEILGPEVAESTRKIPEIDPETEEVTYSEVVENKEWRISSRFLRY